MGELNIEKVPEDKFVKPADGYTAGYYGYTPDDTDADSDTVAAQGPIAEAAYSAAAAPAKTAPAKKETAK